MGKFRQAAVSATAVIIIGCFFWVFLFHMETAGNTFKSSVKFSGGWYYSDGTPADPEALRFTGGVGVIAISRKLKAGELMGRSLAFESNNLFFDVYAGDMLIYDFHPELNGVVGQYYGRYQHYIHIPPVAEGCEIRIEYTDLLPNARWTKFKDMKLCYPDEDYRADIRKNLLPFGICVVTFVFGIVMLIVGIIAGRSGLEAVALGTFAIVLSAWTNSQTGFMELITDNSAVARIIEYISLILLPIPCVIYVGFMTQTTKKHIIDSVVNAAIANLFVQVLSVAFFDVDYHDTLFISHLVILYGTTVIIYIYIHAVREELIGKIQKRYLMIAFSIIIVSGLADMVIYYTINTDDNARISRVGLLIFVAILAAYEVKQIISANVSQKEMEVMRRIANTDALTGLLNRTAYQAFEKEALKRKKGVIAVVHMDVNCLKQVNDNYGHEEGDRHLKAAAEIISGSFGEFGDCYRTGGDEYVVIMNTPDCELKYEACVKKLNELEGRHNFVNRPPVRMEIAHGMAVCNFGKDDFRECQRLADSRMYDNKDKIKELRKQAKR